MTTQTTTWISRARLNLAHAKIAQLAEMALGDPYREHQLIWQFFDGDPAARRRSDDGAPPLFLYRRENHGSNTSFYLVSRQPPQAESLLWHLESKPYQPTLAPGDRIAFQLRANPTVAQTSPLNAQELARYNAGRRERGLPEKEKQDRRQFHDILLHTRKQVEAQGLAGSGVRAAVNEAACAWLTRQGPRLGLDFDQVEITGDQYLDLRPARNRDAITFSAVDYQGTATVSDPALATVALTHGIGRAKAFGMGLMLVRRLSS